LLLLRGPDERDSFLVHPALTLVEIYPTTAKLNHSFEVSDVMIAYRSSFYRRDLTVDPFRPLALKRDR